MEKWNNFQEAEKSLRFYRNISPEAAVSENKSFEDELSKLKYVFSEMQRKDTESATAAPLTFRDFFNRPFTIGCVIMLAHELNGGFTMCSYAGMVFAKSGSTMSPGISSIIVAGIQFLGSYVSTVLIDRAGRKVFVANSDKIQAFLLTYVLFLNILMFNLTSC